MTPLAVGEVFNSIWDSKRLIEGRLIDFIRSTIVQRTQSPFDLFPTEQRGEATGSGFVIDAAGVVRKVFPRVKVDGHSDEVLDTLINRTGRVGL